jgi:hypothetical protein
MMSTPSGRSSGTTHRFLMKLTSALTIALLVASLAVSAQGGKLILWKVSGNGLKQPSYLFGTRHTTPSTLLDKFPIKSYWEEAQFGLFEVVGTPLVPAATQPKKTSAPKRPQPPLDSLFSKQDYTLVDSFFSASPLGSIKEHNRDVNLQSLMFAAKRLKQNPTIEQIGLDDGIAREMKRIGKPRFRLDLDNDPDREAMENNYTFWANGIVSTIKDKGNGNALATNSDAAYLAELSVDLKLREEATGLQRDLTERRNLVWVPPLEQKMKEGSCFVAVGLLHLKYKSGLIMLLRQRGYKVKPIKLAAND